MINPAVSRPWCRHAALAVAVGAAVATLSGCGGTPTSGTPAPGSVASGGPAAVSAAPAAGDGTAAHPLPWGGTYDGKSLSVTMGTPVPFTPSNSAFVQTKGSRAVLVEISVTNLSATDPMPAMALTVQATAGDTEVRQIQDSASGVGSPEAQILPGKTLTWKAGFPIPAGATELNVQTSSMGGGKTVYFGGKV